MRRIILNITSTTGITLVILAIIGTLSGAKFIFINSVFQSLAANIIIHLGYLLTGQFESEYVILEATLDLGYTIIVLITFGYTFHWFTSTPIWMLVIMAMVIYFVGLLLNIFRIQEEIDIINGLLQSRNKNQNKGI
ncbi:hypothetical protein [Kineothrix sp. MB12-C1]|uniref:hypothetical protein n=1 Tax=Kineothrix sp. MB12-C1 TaxID=3070215 RepID=UPI0027D24D38|nr:hypothetical protein [Kineothrix sp. MB12-C1]WMC92336.1 hypothetical protein RBB56_16050 [Kineothrix sp. MB12-C1]